MAVLIDWLAVKVIVPPKPAEDEAEILLEPKLTIALVRLEGFAVILIVPPLPLTPEAPRLPAFN